MPESLQIAAVAGIIVVCLAALAAGWNQLDEMFKRRAGTDGNRTIGPQPFEVKAADEFVHVRTFEEHAAKNTERHAQLFSAIEAVKDEARRELKQDTSELHEKINKVDREVGGIAKGMEFQNQQLASINQTVLSILKKGGS